MKDHECPHLSECKQFILKHDFVWKCLGKTSWNQENCFKSNLIGIKEMRRLPIEWWAFKLIETLDKAQLEESKNKK
jgi:hypothetical protein